MKPFIFSADSHVMEPNELFLDGLPTSLARHAIRTWVDGDYLLTGTDEKIIYRLRIGKHREFELGDDKRKGARELSGRFEDMELEGIDAEIVFPSLGLWLHGLENSDAEAASARIYNDWNNAFLGGHPNRFVRCAILPVRDLSNAIAELRYIYSLGMTAAMIPAAMQIDNPKYNDPAWDPLFKLAGELGIVFMLHTGTGLESVVHERGPGAAIINYTKQMNDALESAMYLVAGGVLDRNPEARVAFIESGASWLIALAERLDEVHDAHAVFVHPKLSRAPSEIIDDQMWASFQHDRGCILTSTLRGGKNVIWGSDYPHNEGTFPISRPITIELFEGLDVTRQQQENILGLNAARLFRIEPTISTNPVWAQRPETVTA